MVEGCGHSADFESSSVTVTLRCRFVAKVDANDGVQALIDSEPPIKPSKFFYGWTIVAVGFLAHIASAFTISSTLSVFLKPLSSDLGVSRGVFSLVRSGEVLIGAVAAPLVGTLLDRHGCRGLMAVGGVIAGLGLLLLGQVRDFCSVYWSAG